MRTKSQGFTLVELIVVVIILAILAAVAIPLFIDLKTDAASAASAYQAGHDVEQVNREKLACVVRGGTAESCGL